MHRLITCNKVSPVQAPSVLTDQSDLTYAPEEEWKLSSERAKYCRAPS